MINKTNQREAILRELKMLKSHPTADELYAVLKRKVPQISLGTIYRNLEQMSRSGLILKLDMAGRQMRFDGNTSSHYHMRCTDCDALLNVDARGLEHLNQAIEKALPELGCEKFRLEFFGLCGACRARRAEIEAMRDEEYSAVN